MESGYARESELFCTVGHSRVPGDVSERIDEMRPPVRTSKGRNPPPSPYGRQVGASIIALSRLFQDQVPDPLSLRQILNVALSEDWSRAHGVRSQVRSRLLLTSNAEDPVRLAQYWFEESCLETLCNDTQPDDPFDSISPYWVVPNAIKLAGQLSVPIDDVLAAVWPTAWRRE